MNLLEALSRKLKNDWTGGASGDPGRYHAPGAFEDFRIADLFNNDRWTREPMVDPNSSSGFLENRDGTPRYTSYYKPRGAVNVTETEKRDNKGETTTQVVTKYQVGKPEVTSEPFPRVAGSGARVSDPMNTRPGTFMGSLHHPPNIAGMGSRVAPGLISQGAYDFYDDPNFQYWLASPGNTDYKQPYPGVTPTGAPDPDLHLKFSTFPYNSTPYKPPLQPPHALEQLRQPYQPQHALDQLAQPYQPPSPISYNRGGVDRHLGSFQLRTHPSLRSRRTEDEGREEEIWEFYKKLKEAGLSKVEAAQATAIFFSRGDAPAGLLERAN